MHPAGDRYLTDWARGFFNAWLELKESDLHRIITSMDKYRGLAMRTVPAMIVVLMLAPGRLALAEHRAAYDRSVAGYFSRRCTLRPPSIAPR